MKRSLRYFSLLLLLNWLAGCASYDANVAPGRSLAGVERYFVLSNQNDNRALDHHIAAALMSHGLTASTGPLTMMPDDTQAIVSYQDNWTWDFGEHLVYLQISVRDRQSYQPFATIQFSSKIPARKTAARITEELVGQLLAN